MDGQQTRPLSWITLWQKPWWSPRRLTQESRKVSQWKIMVVSPLLLFPGNHTARVIHILGFCQWSGRTREIPDIVQNHVTSLSVADISFVSYSRWLNFQATLCIPLNQCFSLTYLIFKLFFPVCAHNYIFYMKKTEVWVNLLNVTVESAAYCRQILKH